MKTVLSSLAAVALPFAFTVSARSEDKKTAEKGKEVTLKGTLVCGKCTLKETDACSNVLQVKKGEKTVNYYLQDEGKPEKYHQCPPNKKAQATVTGVVTKKDGKMYIKASKVVLTKKKPKPE